MLPTTALGYASDCLHDQRRLGRNDAMPPDDRGRNRAAAVVARRRLEHPQHRASVI
jgi:hypothetical protein